MSTFSILILGHLLGDWLLQSDWMALGKRKGLFTWAGMAHFALYTISILVALWVFSSTPLSAGLWLTLGVTIFITHWLVDSTDVVKGWMRLWGQRDQEIVRLMVDQTFHIIILGALVKVIVETV